MLHDFITTHRAAIIQRTRASVATRGAPVPTDVEIMHGVPLFLDQLVVLLRAAAPNASEIGSGALLHGRELFDQGLTVGQVVHDYGNICQAITELAVELNHPIDTDDFRRLNFCLDVAIAEAVTQYARQREETLLGEGVEHLGFLAHELRNLLNTATLAFDAVRSGRVGIAGSTGAILGRSLAGIRDIVNRSLAEVRLEAGPPRRERVMVVHLLEEVEIGASMQARAREVVLAFEPSEPDLSIVGDAQILGSIVTNLVQNACKFTRKQGHVVVRARATEDRVCIDVADECGGLPPGDHADLFRPYQQRGSDRSGLGLGLAVSRKGARAIGGDILVRDVPGSGCVFTVDLERSVSPASSPPSP